MKNLLAGLLTAFALFAITGGTPATAQNTPRLEPGMQIAIGGVILCDTREQILEVVEAHVASFDAGRMVVFKYHGIKNDLNEPACGFMQAPAPYFIMEVEDEVYDVETPNRTRVEVRIVSVGYPGSNGPAEGWIFVAKQYTDPPSEDI